TKELDAARHLLDDAKQRARLPVLPNIRVATPCHADWAKMTGDDRVRACADCNKNVYNLSEMTRDEAEALIVAKEGRLCVRYFQRKDGTILLKDCAVGIAKKRKRRLIAVGAAAMLAGGGFAAYKRTEPRGHVTGMLGGAVIETPITGELVTEHEVAPPDDHLVEPMQGQMIMGDISAPIDESTKQLEEGDVIVRDGVPIVAPK
ncbi:MAG TPA: hypothetical protein VIV40_23000, partial [Kofleriaceae bacterium]